MAEASAFSYFGGHAVVRLGVCMLNCVDVGSDLVSVSQQSEGHISNK